MKILELLNDKEVNGKDKLKAVKELVKSTRGSYGNKESEIAAQKVNTVNGMVPVALLTTDEKVAVALQAINSAVANATIITEGVEGSVFDAEFERIIAVDAVLVNLGAKSDSKY